MPVTCCCQGIFSKILAVRLTSKNQSLHFHITSSNILKKKQQQGLCWLWSVPPCERLSHGRQDGHTLRAVWEDEFLHSPLPLHSPLTVLQVQIQHSRQQRENVPLCVSIGVTACSLSLCMNILYTYSHTEHDGYEEENEIYVSCAAVSAPVEVLSVVLYKRRSFWNETDCGNDFHSPLKVLLLAQS